MTAKAPFNWTRPTVAVVENLIRDREPCTAVKIADATGHKQDSVMRVLMRLEHHGWVESDRPRGTHHRHFWMAEEHLIDARVLVQQHRDRKAPKRKHVEQWRRAAQAQERAARRQGMCAASSVLGPGWNEVECQRPATVRVANKMAFVDTCRPCSSMFTVESDGYTVTPLVSEQAASTSLLAGSILLVSYVAPQES